MAAPIAENTKQEDVERRRARKAERERGEIGASVVGPRSLNERGTRTQDEARRMKQDNDGPAKAAEVCQASAIRTVPDFRGRG